MRLTSLADYAVVILAAAAKRGRVGRLSAGVLAEETGIPLPTVQKLLGRLAVTGLLRSTRGTGGGFQLARPPEGISLAEIVEAVEGPIAMTSCVETGRHDCVLESGCRVRPHWAVVNGAIRGALAEVSLARLAGDVG